MTCDNFKNGGDNRCRFFDRWLLQGVNLLAPFFYYKDVDNEANNKKIKKGGETALQLIIAR